MNRIDCKDKSCCHNEACHCMKESIMVSEKAYCHSQVDKLIGSVPTAMNEFARENICEEDDGHYIACECVTCATNVKGTCVNSDVHFFRKDTGTRCVSYHEK